MRGAGGRKGADASRPGRTSGTCARRRSSRTCSAAETRPTTSPLPPPRPASLLARKRPRGAFGVPAAISFSRARQREASSRGAGRASEAEWTWIEATARAERGHGAMGLAQGAGGAQRAPESFRVARGGGARAGAAHRGSWAG